MQDDLFNFLIEKSGAPTLVLVALAVIWDRLKRLEAALEDHARKLWDFQGEDEHR